MKFITNKKIKHTILAICIFTIVLFPLLYTSAAPNFNDIKEMLKIGGKASHFQADKFESMEITALDVWIAIMNASLAGIGIVFFIYLFYGGYVLMTARGNEEKVERAKNVIITTIMGIIIVVLAYLITAYVFDKITEGLQYEYFTKELIRYKFLT